MREIVLDTETTGFEPTEGHRIVEIGAIELENHLPTGRVYHQYLDPQRPMPPEAFEVHGLGDVFLRGKPVFRDVAQAFLDFIGEAKMVIHNASFDMKFLNAELRAAGKTALPDARAHNCVFAPGYLHALTLLLCCQPALRVGWLHHDRVPQRPGGMRSWQLP